MSNIVFVLGAGASKRAGAPLMAEFLDVARNLLARNELRDVKEPFHAVFKAIGALQQVHSKSEFDIHNIESVFAAVEMGKTLERFPGCESFEEIESLAKSLKILISTTIEHTLMFPVMGSGPASQHLECPEPYGPFVKFLSHLKESAYPKRTVAVMTFNYDVAADLALHKQGLGPNYCLDDSYSAKEVPLLKLHGSLNWARAADGKKIIPWTLRNYLSTREAIQPRDNKTKTLPISAQFSQWDQYSQIIPEPEIVPPTWNKEDYHRTLSRIWARAAKELSEAENIFVIGYSLPDSDAFFKYLYALGSVSDIPLQRFWVFNPDDTGEVEARFKKLLGPGARDRFKYFPNTFQMALGTIMKEFPART